MLTCGELLRQLITNLLNDEEGISLESYESLLEYMSKLKEHDLIDNVNNNIKRYDGRFFLSGDIKLI